MSDANCLLEQLTHDAIAAACDGQWDLVIALYDQRMTQLQHNPIAPGLTQKLVKWDQWLVARVLEAQAAIQQNLLEIQDKKRKLEILKRQWGESSTAQARHLLTI
jgi:hypothetical protein